MTCDDDDDDLETQAVSRSTGSGKIIVEFFSADIWVRVWR